MSEQFSYQVQRAHSACLLLRGHSSNAACWWKCAHERKTSAVVNSPRRRLCTSSVYPLEVSLPCRQHQHGLCDSVRNPLLLNYSSPPQSAGPCGSSEEAEFVPLVIWSSLNPLSTLVSFVSFVFCFVYKTESGYR